MKVQAMDLHLSQAPHGQAIDIEQHVSLAGDQEAGLKHACEAAGILRDRHSFRDDDSLHPLLFTDCAQHNVPSVNGHPEVDCKGRRCLVLVAPPRSVQQLQASVHSIVGVGEDRSDTTALKLVNEAAVAAEGGARLLQPSVEKLEALVRGHPLGEGGEVADVADQDARPLQHTAPALQLVQATDPHEVQEVVRNEHSNNRAQPILLPELHHHVVLHRVESIPRGLHGPRHKHGHRGGQHTAQNSEHNEECQAGHRGLGIVLGKLPDLHPDISSQHPHGGGDVSHRDPPLEETQRGHRPGHVRHVRGQDLGTQLSEVPVLRAVDEDLALRGLSGWGDRQKARQELLPLRDGVGQGGVQGLREQFRQNHHSHKAALPHVGHPGTANSEHRLPHRNGGVVGKDGHVVHDQLVPVNQVVIVGHHSIEFLCKVLHGVTEVMDFL
eukprot:RCo045208